MKYLVTGAAGFIGFHVAAELLDSGFEVIGLDNLNDYYEVSLKRARLAELEKKQGFSFIMADVADRKIIEELPAKYPDIAKVIHLAAQAGVRYSLENPYAYERSNVAGQVVMLELAKSLKNLRSFVYASSSSVYGANTKVPFAESDRTDNPVSLYAATKKAGELITESYVRMYDMAATGLRFFTVYGPWGRPDMSPWLFTDAILAGKPIKLFNYGESRRDFTFIDDVVQGVVAASEKQQAQGEHKIYNLGNDSPVGLKRYVEVIENLLGVKAMLEPMPMQAGDVAATWADITLARNELAYNPQTVIEEGMKKFINWFREYKKI